ncbi:MAG: polysaccharide biosynthesis tyrosine autokinase, partial [Planctomycetes bacterium]|nr:polysaccharide biosynthesis tyrosine autokinase [Planctomycetota bacterium]
IMMVLLGVLTYGYTLISPGAKTEFRATASVRVSRLVTPTGVFIQALDVNEANDIATQVVRITSQETLLKSAQKINRLPESVQSASIEEILKFDPQLLREKGVDEAISSLRMKVLAQQKSNTNIIDITAREESEAMAIELANTVAEVYKESSDADNNERVRNAKKFVEDKLKEAQETYRKAQEDLNKFRQEHFGTVSVAREQFRSLFAERDKTMDRIEAIKSQVAQLKQREAADMDQDVIDFIAGELETRTLQKLNNDLIDLQLEKLRLMVYLKAEAPQIIDLERRIKSIVRNMRNELDAEQVRLQKKVDDIQRTLDRAPGIDLQLAAKDRDVATANRLVEEWEKSLAEINVKLAERVETVKIEERAVAATEIKGAGPWTKVIVGAIVGAIFGFLLAIVFEVLDTSIDTIEDVETFLETPVIGVVPHIDVEDVKARVRESSPEMARHMISDGSALLITQLGPKSASAEAFRTLRTNVEFAMMQNKGKAFLITSSALGEGKTTVAANLAISMAQNGRRTLLVSADLRRPTIYRMFGLDRQPGLTDVLLGRLNWKEATKSISDVFLGGMSSRDVMRTPGLENLSIMTSGGIPSNPSELLSSSRMPEMIAEVKQNFDVVLFDAPPVLPVADAAVLSSKLDAVVLVYKVGEIGRAVLRRAKVQLDNVGATVLGIVLNDLTSEIAEFRTESQYYRQYYYKEEEPRQSSSWLSKAFASAGRGLGGRK